MDALSAEDVGGPPKRPKSRRSFARNSLELCLIALLALTVGVICFQHRIFGRDIVVTSDTARKFAHDGYADQSSGGNSSFAKSSRPLSWSCELRPAYRWPYCGYEVVFDQYGLVRGADLRDLDSVRLSLDYHGPATTLRFDLKNEDPGYTKRGDRTTDKVNGVEFSVHNGRQTLVFHPEDFSVPHWWLSKRKLTLELSRTQLDDVVSLELVTGSDAPIGRYSFRIDSLTLQRSIISPAQLYLYILGVWAVLIGLYLIARVHWARRDAFERACAQAEVRAALAKAKDAAERASKAKSDFLASMSHELRTPLNAVLGYAQLLERADLSQDHLEAVRTIRSSGDHLLSLISDLLDLSKIEAGKMELHPAPAELRGVIASVADMVRVRAEEKGVAFSCEVGEGVPEAVEADEKRLKQILLNLLGNAVKFTSQGGVALRVELLDRAGDRAVIRFEVRDSGPGISEQELERIFRPFEQAGDVQRREGGTGLGLAISRQLAALMGATIEVESRPGEGARFWFDVGMPMVDAIAEPADSPLAAAVEGQGVVDPDRRLRILAAEDNPTNQAILRALLQALDVDLELAANGLEAVRAFEHREFDLVLMDVHMPEMNGIEATRAIRRIEASSCRAHTPIVALSANVMADHIAEYRAAGMDAHIDKPIEIQPFYALIEKAAAGAPLEPPAARRRRA